MRSLSESEMNISSKRTIAKAKRHAEKTVHQQKEPNPSVRKSLDSSTAVPVPVPSIIDEHGITVISEAGDLLLVFEHEQGQQTHLASFRVDSVAVRNASPYFQVLLDPSRFEEGRRVATALADHQAGTNGSTTPRGSQIEAARPEQSDLVATPRAILPTISIQDIGNISPVKNITLLITDFLRLLHSQLLTVPQPPLINLANLSIVFDRFSALPILTKYAHTHHLFAHLDAKLKPRTLAEDRQRQRSLIALHLSHPPWLAPSTQRLIERSPLLSPSDPASSPAWTDLPCDLEDELAVRRRALLATLQSIQSFLLARYASRGAVRQCKLGYESSVACDAFQLGEAVKFFARAGTLSLAGTLLAPAAAAASEGTGDEGEEAPDPLGVIERWRACPEYQIDANHHHCGIRTRLLPCLEMVERAVEESGVCGDCWRDRRGEYAWREAKGLLVWRKGQEEHGRKGFRGDQGCLGRHLAVRDMCLAAERVWC